MSKLNIAVLGLNHGWKFVEALKKSKTANLIAISDLSAEKEKMVPGVKYYQDYLQLINELEGKLDGIVAALPNDLHLSVTEEAAKRGIHVLLEKPIAGSISEAEMISRVLDKYQIKFLVGHHRRFSAKINCLKQVLEKGDLGRIIGANMIWAAKKPDDYFNNLWRIKEGVGGPLLINIIHTVDDLRYLIGEIDMVQAYVTNKFRGNDVEDTGVMNFKFKNGAVASVFLTDHSPSTRFYEACAQEDPFFYPSNYDCYFFYGEKASIAFPSLEMISYEPTVGEGWHRPFQKCSFPVERVNPIEEEIKHFCEIITGKAESRVNAADATVNLRVIEAIKESSNTGKAVFL